jgi:putative nicotinate phosphoribosyltransferase
METMMETLAPTPEMHYDYERMANAAANRIINTDTYNRTMDHLRGPEGWRKQETYVLQMRRSPYGYLVAAGIEDAVQELVTQPITQAELTEAETYYADNNVPFFNRDMWQEIIDEYDGYLPIEVHGAPDGTVLLPGEPALRITGPGELIAHFEHLFHRPFYDTLVATKAHEITKLLGDPNRFIEVGKRGTPDEMIHLRAIKAMQIGGDLTLTSNDAAGMAFDGIRSVGTIGHRYVQRFPSVEAAFRHAVENLDTVSLLVDLVDSYDGMNTALQLKEEFRDTDKNIWVRLDSGNLKEQLRYYLDECAARGFTDPVKDRITVEGFETLADIAEMEAMLTEDEKKRVVYGGGGILVAQQTARSDASTGFKLAEFEASFGVLLPSQKFSDSPGKESLPGNPTVVVVDGLKRYIAQHRELDGVDLLAPLYVEQTLAMPTDISAARARRQTQMPAVETMLKAKETAIVSPLTQQKMGQVALRYGLAAA